jgi:hypothetical protein
VVAPIAIRVEAGTLMTRARHFAMRAKRAGTAASGSSASPDPCPAAGAGCAWARSAFGARRPAAFAGAGRPSAAAGHGWPMARRAVGARPSFRSSVMRFSCSRRPTLSAFQPPGLPRPATQDPGLSAGASTGLPTPAAPADRSSCVAALEGMVAAPHARLPHVLTPERAGVVLGMTLEEDGGRTTPTHNGVDTYLVRIGKYLQSHRLELGRVQIIPSRGGATGDAGAPSSNRRPAVLSRVATSGRLAVPVESALPPRAVPVACRAQMTMRRPPTPDGGVEARPFAALGRRWRREAR